MKLLSQKFCPTILWCPRILCSTSSLTRSGQLDPCPPSPRLTGKLQPSIIVKHGAEIDAFYVTSGLYHLTQVLHISLEDNGCGAGAAHCPEAGLGCAGLIRTSDVWRRSAGWWEIQPTYIRARCPFGATGNISTFVVARAFVYTWDRSGAV